MNIANSSVPEDHFIAYLAGVTTPQQTNGPIQNKEYPTTNKLVLGRKSIEFAVVKVAQGVLLYPLFNNDTRHGILGSAFSVCPAYLTYLLKGNPNVEAAKIGVQCLYDNTALMACRVANYVAGTLHAVVDNYLLIGAGIACLSLATYLL